MVFPWIRSGCERGNCPRLRKEKQIPWLVISLISFGFSDRFSRSQHPYDGPQTPHSESLSENMKTKIEIDMWDGKKGLKRNRTSLFPDRPFRATGAGWRCCCLRASRSLCRCTSSAGPLRSCPGTSLPAQYRCSWMQSALVTPPPGPAPERGGGRSERNKWRWCKRETAWTVQMHVLVTHQNEFKTDFDLLRPRQHTKFSYPLPQIKFSKCYFQFWKRTFLIQYKTAWAVCAGYVVQQNIKVSSSYVYHRLYFTHISKNPIIKPYRKISKETESN